MATLAHEIGFSETTFVTGVREGGYDVRIFTPDAELPFAGHPTLGTAFTMVSEDRVAPSLIQTSAAGDVPVDVDLAAGTAWMQQLPPVFGNEVLDRAAVARAAGLELTDLVEGLPILPGSTGLVHLMVPAARRGGAPPGSTRRRRMPERLCGRRGRVALPLRGPW